MEKLKWKQVHDFMEKFHTFLEYDSRHRIVIRSSDELLTYFVFDEENIILAYGDVESYKEILRGLGFEEQDHPIILPDPHMHMYHEQLDRDEDKLLSFFPWSKSKLLEIDR
ncbi:hypothetical protein ACFQ88_03320 [Paenibacillus sp. NPDC056579]|uniref:hypothetical protein n=1 Tax=unclassified Paenibacillus TaxID=185978 RepID=UPI001EF7DE7E|nr:hypothetical protein [Paenibacillus sp. H1-7]ULL16052.1 hypothetical protein DVH26_17325 [Paenibacillus sp. H1-7]